MAEEREHKGVGQEYEAVVRCPYCGIVQKKDRELVKTKHPDAPIPGYCSLSVCVRDPAIYESSGIVFVKCDNDKCGKVFKRTMVPVYKAEKVNEE